MSCSSNRVIVQNDCKIDYDVVVTVGYQCDREGRIRTGELPILEELPLLESSISSLISQPAKSGNLRSRLHC